jgi:glycosyltransferase involved in cell wall biosynthesis
VHEPKVTVVIANHNYGKWLPEAIRSAVEDPWPNKLIVVVDDGSTDGSPHIVRSLMGDIQPWTSPDGQMVGIEGKYIGADVPIRLVVMGKANGPSVARNVAIETTWQDTDYYAILDADDKFKPGKIEACVRRMMAAPEEIGAVYTDYDTVNQSWVVTRVLKEPFNYNRLVRECIVHSACVINKKALEKVGVYDPELRTCEDYDLWLRISEKFLICHVPQSLMTVRVGDHDSTHTVQKETWNNNWQRVMTKLQQRHNG